MDTLNDMFRLRAEHVRSAAEVLARAFADEPLFASALPDPTERDAKLRYFMEFEIRQSIVLGEAYAPSPALEGIAGWLPSQKCMPSLPDVFRSGLFSLLTHTGIGPALKMWGFEAGFARMWRRHMRSPHMVLDVLGVDPEHQGRGFGTMLLAAMLERLDVENIPACLGTTREQNVRFYRHHGFQVLDSDSLGDDRVPIWLMSRPPRSRHVTGDTGLAAEENRRE